MDIFGEYETQEAFQNEGDSQFKYEEKVTKAFALTEKYLEKRLAEPPSVVGSDVGIELNLEEEGVEVADITEELINREIATMRACLENNTQTNTAGNVNFGMELFQSSLPAETSVVLETQNDDWIGQQKVLPRRPQGQVILPPLRLELFDGNCTKWLEFSAGFKALLHDVIRLDYQRMAYLRMYLTSEIRSSIAGLLNQPSHYQEALQALKSRYGHPILLAKANTTLINNPPVVRPGDPQLLGRYVGCLNDAIANLNRTGQVGELKSPKVVEIASAKLPRDLKGLWGEEIARSYQVTSLVSLKDWLDLKLMGQ